mmetsp:Transcript_22642/g.37292  ORF Transcript_22642/g.37292 Transcript_22642/m.37292 type:complete len:218 (+) Transcript_22642:422-1075(+)
MAINSFGPGATKRATSVSFGNTNGPDAPSSSNSSAIFDANPKAFFFFFFPPIKPPLDRFPFLSIATMLHSTLRSPFHNARASSARLSSLNTALICCPPRGWNISTNKRANSLFDVSSFSIVSPSSLDESPSVNDARLLLRPPEDFFFSTPKLAPTGISTSIRDNLFSSAFCTAPRHLDMASFTSFGSCCSFVVLSPKTLPMDRRDDEYCAAGGVFSL